MCNQQLLAWASEPGGGRGEGGGPKGALRLQSVSQTWAWASFTNIWPYVTHLLPREACKHWGLWSGLPSGQGEEVAMTCPLLPLRSKQEATKGWLWGVHLCR